jgi:predicted aminopeptidase
LLLLSPGCALPYVAHASWGQARILLGRESIDDRLEDPNVSAREKEKLRLVLDVKRYAREVVGLAGEESYSSVFDTKGQPVAWNLSACADDAFRPFVWDFPIVGALPYKGYFHLEPAREEALELKAEHYDVALRPVAAYSTLGWFADPLFTPMLEDDDDELANVIFHELAHATVFVEADADFNETLATFVGNQASRDFFSLRGGGSDPRVLHAFATAHDDEVFSAEIRGLRAKLDAVYGGSGTREAKLAEKARLVREFRDSFRTTVKPKLQSDRYDAFARRELNNAEILGLARYHGDLDSFAAFHAKHGGNLRVTIEKLKAIGREPRPGEALRAAAKN